MLKVPYHLAVKHQVIVYCLFCCACSLQTAIVVSGCSKDDSLDKERLVAVVLLITSNNAEPPAARVTSAEDYLMTAMQVAVTENQKDRERCGKTSEHHQQIHFFQCFIPQNNFFYFRLLRNQATKRNQKHGRKNTGKQHVGRRYIEIEDLAQCQEVRR